MCVCVCVCVCVCLREHAYTDARVGVCKCDLFISEKITYKEPAHNTHVANKEQMWMVLRLVQFGSPTTNNITLQTVLCQHVCACMYECVRACKRARRERERERELSLNSSHFLGQTFHCLSVDSNLETPLRTE